MEVGVAEAEADVVLTDDVAVVEIEVLVFSLVRVDELWVGVPLVVDLWLSHEVNGQSSSNLMLL